MIWTWVICDIGSGVWCLVSGVWRLASGVWRLASGVWRLASGVWRLGSGIWRLGSGTGSGRNRISFFPQIVVSKECKNVPCILIEVFVAV
jgi:hypothetical protein